MSTSSCELEMGKIDAIKLHKMAFVFNALNDGWAVKKRKNLYIFTKRHEGKKAVFLDEYLRQFITNNLNVNSIDL